MGIIQLKHLISGLLLRSELTGKHGKKKVTILLQFRILNTIFLLKQVFYYFKLKLQM